LRHVSSISPEPRPRGYGISASNHNETLRLFGMRASLLTMACQPYNQNFGAHLDSFSLAEQPWLSMTGSVFSIRSRLPDVYGLREMEVRWGRCHAESESYGLLVRNVDSVPRKASSRVNVVGVHTAFTGRRIRLLCQAPRKRICRPQGRARADSYWDWRFWHTMVEEPITGRAMVGLFQAPLAAVGSVLLYSIGTLCFCMSCTQ
jgi:hypothetical protein